MARLIIVSKSVVSFDELRAMRARMPSEEDFEAFVAWDDDVATEDEWVVGYENAMLSLREHIHHDSGGLKER